MAQFTNVATLNYDGGSVNSNVVTGEIRQSLTVTKDAVLSTYSYGDTVTYVINIVNSGSTSYTGLTVTDNLGEYGSLTSTTEIYPLTYIAGSIKYYINGNRQNIPTITSTQPLTITGITVPAGGNTALVYETEVNSFAPLDANGRITNILRVTGTGITTPNTAIETIAAAAAANLSITKEMSPTVVNENGTVTYTFNILNSGNTAADASDAVSITDTFNPPLNDITVTYNGTTITQQGFYCYSEQTGVFTTTAGQITVPAATYSTAADGSYTVIPGTATVTVTGTI